ncbi:MAG: ribonuclease activity regulator RraA, partial [Burkholderiaceae bacterium]
VGDSDGVVVLPKEIAEELAHEAFDMSIFEDFVMECVREGRSIRGLYPLTDSSIEVDFNEWKKKVNR